MRARPRLANDVASEIRQYIASELSPGAKLPSEKDFAEQLGVSRNTVREALLSLWSEGLVTRRWGVGTFVREADEPMAQNFSDVMPMSTLMSGTSHIVTLSDVVIERVQCPADARTALSLGERSTVWHVGRTFAVDGQPGLVLLDWLPMEINGRPIDPTGLKDVNSDMLSLFRDVARCRIVRMEAQLSAEALEVGLARRLEVAEGTPVLKSVQVSVSDAGDAVIFSRNYYLTEVMNLRVLRTPRV
jgi:GntR family transcriptional regulator